MNGEGRLGGDTTKTADQLATAKPEFIAHRRQDGYAAPAPEDRVDLAALAAVEALGYRVAVQCVDCGHWLASPISVSAHRGPRCRARRGGD